MFSVAVGCPDMTAPANAWIERSEERMIVRCNYSLETWYLTCKGNDWIGTFTNCTDGNNDLSVSGIDLLAINDCIMYDLRAIIHIWGHIHYVSVRSEHFLSFSMSSYPRQRNGTRICLNLGPCVCALP